MRSKHLVHGLLVASVCLFGSTAAAQQSGLGKFLHSVNNGLSNVNQALSGQAPPPENKPAHDVGQQRGSLEILRKYADANLHTWSYGDACYTIRLHSGDAANFRLGNYLEAQAGYYLDASNTAQCAVGTRNVGPTAGIERIPVTAAIQRVGSDLAMSAIAAKRGDAVLPETVLMAQDALNLLNTNPSANAELIERLTETGLLGTAPPTIASVADAVPMRASEAVKAYNGNTFGFKAKYNGKTLKVSGEIQLINGSAKQATVTLLGYMPPNPDNQGYQHQVRCEVMDQSALSRVMDLQVGKRVTVMGLFEPDSQSFPIGIELQNCIIAG